MRWWLEGHYLAVCWRLGQASKTGSMFTGIILVAIIALLLSEGVVGKVLAGGHWEGWR
jgi:hypothetical protein